MTSPTLIILLAVLAAVSVAGQNVELSYLMNSEWSQWSPWSFCSNGVRVRVRACTTVRGFKCVGHNKEFSTCEQLKPKITTNNGRQTPVTDYDSIDPWKDDRKMAMSQLYDDYDNGLGASDKQRNTVAFTHATRQPRPLHRAQSFREDHLLEQRAQLASITEPDIKERTQQLPQHIPDTTPETTTSPPTTPIPTASTPSRKLTTAQTTPVVHTSPSINFNKLRNSELPAATRQNEASDVVHTSPSVNTNSIRANSKVPLKEANDAHKPLDSYLTITTDRFGNVISKQGVNERVLKKIPEMRTRIPNTLPSSFPSHDRQSVVSNDAYFTTRIPARVRNVQDFTTRRPDTIKTVKQGEGTAKMDRKHVNDRTPDLISGTDLAELDSKLKDMGFVDDTVQSTMSTVMTSTARPLASTTPSSNNKETNSKVAFLELSGLGKPRRHPHKHLRHRKIDVENEAEGDLRLAVIAEPQEVSSKAMSARIQKPWRVTRKHQKAISNEAARHINSTMNRIGRIIQKLEVDADVLSNHPTSREQHIDSSKMNAEERKLYEETKALEARIRRIQDTMEHSTHDLLHHHPIETTTAEPGILEGDTARALSWLIANMTDQLGESPSLPVVDIIPLQKVTKRQKPSRNVQAKSFSNEEDYRIPKQSRKQAETKRPQSNSKKTLDSFRNDPANRMMRLLGSQGAAEETSDTEAREPLGTQFSSTDSSWRWSDWSEWSECNCDQQRRKRVCLEDRGIQKQVRQREEPLELEEHHLTPRWIARRPRRSVCPESEHEIRECDDSSLCRMR